jgi:hypothetical protein
MNFAIAGLPFHLSVPGAGWSRPPDALLASKVWLLTTVKVRLLGGQDAPDLE